MNKINRVRFTSGLSGEGYQDLDDCGLLLAVYAENGEEIHPVPEHTCEIVREVGEYDPERNDDHGVRWSLMERDWAVARQGVPNRDLIEGKMLPGGCLRGYRIEGGSVSSSTEGFLVRPTTKIRDVRGPFRWSGLAVWCFEASPDGETWYAISQPVFYGLVTSSGACLISQDLWQVESWHFEPKDFPGSLKPFAKGYATAAEAFRAAEAWEASQ